MTATLILSLSGLALLAWFGFEPAPLSNAEPYRADLDRRVIAPASGLPPSDSGRVLALDDCWSADHWSSAL